MIAGSVFRVIWKTCHSWWYQRCFLTGAAAEELSRAMGRKSTDANACSGRQRASRLAASWRDVVGSPRWASASGIGPAVATHRLAPQASGAVRRAHQGTGHHAEEPEPLGLRGQLDELLRAHPAVHRVVPHGRAQVLGDRDEVAAGLVQLGERLDDLVGGLAHAEDQVRLGDQTGLVRPGDDRQGPVVAEAGADRLEDAGDGLEVVREHLGLPRRTPRPAARASR